MEIARANSFRSHTYEKRGGGGPELKAVSRNREREYAGSHIKRLVPATEDHYRASSSEGFPALSLPTRGNGSTSTTARPEVREGRFAKGMRQQTPSLRLPTRVRPRARY